MNPMTIRYPPRREPRVLAIAEDPAGLAFAVADPWVVRGAGKIPCRPRSRLAAVSRLVRREKPTALAVVTPALRRTVHRVGRAQGIPVVPDPLPDLPRAIARELYPEVPVLAPDALNSVATAAIAAVLHAPIPPRKYAPRRRHPPVRRPR